MDTRSWKKRLQDPKELVEWAKIASLISLLLGGLVIVIYSASIQHFPPLDMKTSVALIVAIFAIGSTLFFGLIGGYVAPGLIFREAVALRPEFSAPKKVLRIIIGFSLALFTGQVAAILSSILFVVWQWTSWVVTGGVLVPALIAGVSHWLFSRWLTSRDNSDAAPELRLEGQEAVEGNTAERLKTLGIEGHCVLFICLFLPMLFMWAGALLSTVYWAGAFTSIVAWASIAAGTLMLDFAVALIALSPNREAIRLALVVVVVVALPFAAIPLSTATLRMLGIGDLHNVSLLVATSAEPLLRSAGIKTLPAEDPGYRIAGNVHLLLHLGSEYVIAPEPPSKQASSNNLRPRLVIPETLVKAIGWNLPQDAIPASAAKQSNPPPATSAPAAPPVPTPK